MFDEVSLLNYSLLPVTGLEEADGSVTRQGLPSDSGNPN